MARKQGYEILHDAICSVVDAESTETAYTLSDEDLQKITDNVAEMVYEKLTTQKEDVEAEVDES